MLRTMSCDICGKRFITRPSKYSASTLYDTIDFGNINVPNSGYVNGDSHMLILCPDCFFDITEHIATTYDIPRLKDKVEFWRKQRGHKKT